MEQLAQRYTPDELRVCKEGTLKLENVLKGSLDLIPSPSPSVKIQVVGGKVCLRCKSKTLLGIVNKLLKTKSLLTMPSNVLPLPFIPQANFPAHN